MDKVELEKQRKEAIRFLRQYGHDTINFNGRVVLAAPAHSAKNLMRVYMNGGNIGKIALNDNVVTTGINAKKYSNKYSGEKPAVVDVLHKDSGMREAVRLEALTNKEYLQYAEAATTVYSVKTDNVKDKERMVETIIMDFNNQKCGNAAIDMEMQYSVRDHFGWTRDKKAGHIYLSEMEYRKKTWYNEYSFPINSDTKSPRIDLMVLNEEGVGFVELKVNNESCENLGGHIRHMNYILSHKEGFKRDVERRVGVLEKYDLLEPEMEGNLKAWHETKNIWCGILFVGNSINLDGAKDLVRQNIDAFQDGIKCAFVDIEIIKRGKLNLSKEIFVLPSTFLDDSYKGTFE